MCIDLILFDNKEIPSLFICPIGHGVIDKMVSLNCTHMISGKETTFVHIFCEECLQQWFNTTNKTKCPVCMTFHDKKDIHHMPYIDNFKYTLSCKNKDEGCLWNDTLEKYPYHVKECEYNKDKCRRCHISYFKKDTEKHRQDECAYRQCLCDNCVKVYFHKHKDDHTESINCDKCNESIIKCCKGSHKEKCLEEEVNCSFVGCDVKFIRKNINDHNKQFLEHHLMILNDIVKDLLPRTRPKKNKHEYSSECACQICDETFYEFSSDDSEMFTSQKPKKKDKRKPIVESDLSSLDFESEIGKDDNSSSNSDSDLDNSIKNKKLSGFMRFLRDNRKNIKADYPNMKVTELSTKARVIWSNMSENERNEHR